MGKPTTETLLPDFPRKVKVSFLFVLSTIYSPPTYCKNINIAFNPTLDNQSLRTVHLSVLTAQVGQLIPNFQLQFLGSSHITVELQEGGHWKKIGTQTTVKPWLRFPPKAKKRTATLVIHHSPQITWQAIQENLLILNTEGRINQMDVWLQNEDLKWMWMGYHSQLEKRLHHTELKSLYEFPKSAAFHKTPSIRCPNTTSTRRLVRQDIMLIVGQKDSSLAPIDLECPSHSHKITFQKPPTTEKIFNDYKQLNIWFRSYSPSAMQRLVKILDHTLILQLNSPVLAPVSGQGRVVITPPHSLNSLASANVPFQWNVPPGQFSLKSSFWLAVGLFIFTLFLAGTLWIVFGRRRDH